MKAKGVLIDTYKTTTGQFQWELMYWYQFLTLSQDSQITLDGIYSSDQARALHQWSKNLALSNPALPAEGHVKSKEKLLADFHEQKARLKRLQDHVPQLRDDSAVDARLEMLWRSLVLDMTREQGEKMDGFRSMFNCMFGWKDKTSSSSSWKDSNNELFNYTQPLRRRVAACVHGRQVAITRKGHIGMIPVGARV